MIDEEVMKAEQMNRVMLYMFMSVILYARKDIINVATI